MHEDQIKLINMLEKVRAAIHSQEALRGSLPDEMLETMLSQLRSEEATLVTKLYGPGAIAHGEGAVAVTATDGSTAIGNVEGNVYLNTTEQDGIDALNVYRQFVMQSSGQLSLRGLDLNASDPLETNQKLSLAQVYIPLNTKTQLSDEANQQQASPSDIKLRPLPAIEAMASQRRLVILGSPGFGKSTLLNHLALCLAASGLTQEESWLKRLAPWPQNEASVVPIQVTLRDFAVWLGDNSPSVNPRLLWDFIKDRLDALDLTIVADKLHSALQAGDVVLLLDGFDEVPDDAHRTAICNIILAFAERHRSCRMIITCRTLSYQNPDWQLAGFPSFELAGLDEVQILQFIQIWYEELAHHDIVPKTDTNRLIGQLAEAVNRPGLVELAKSPLLLTVMALVHTHKGHLPEARALLYEDTIDILLWRWEQLKATQDQPVPRLRQLLSEVGRTDVDLKRTLWKLAFEAHQKRQSLEDGVVSDIGELRLEKVLAELHPDGSRDWAHHVIRVMKMRAGLLLERAPEIFGFPHRTFQEYLAGAYLSTQSNFAQLAAQQFIEAPYWRESIILAVGRLTHLSGDTDKPLALVAELSYGEVSEHDLFWQKALLAGSILVEVGLHRVRSSAFGRDLVVRLQQRLAALLQTSKLSAIERVTAGQILGQLGDLRSGVTIRPQGETDKQLPDVEFRYVPVGPFFMGSEDNDPDAADDEKPQHLVTMDAPYWMSRYPVTVAQYEVFLSNDGYRAARYWPEAQSHGVWLDGQIVETLSGKRRSRPRSYSTPFNLANHPVVGLNWYEALAFCRWLTEVWRAGHFAQNFNLPSNYEIRLPTEAEWGEGRTWRPVSSAQTV